MKKKVLFVIGSLQLGGAETVLVDILNSINDKFDITLLLIEKRGELISKLHNNIKLRWLCLGKEYCHNKLEEMYYKLKMSLIYRTLGKKANYVKRIHKKKFNNTGFDVEVAFLAGIAANLVKLSPNKKSRKIAWIHAEVPKTDIPTYNKYKIITNGYDDIVGVSEASIKIFEKTFPETKGKITLINNYVDLNKIDKLSVSEPSNYEKNIINLVSVGRLCSDKGFDRVVNVAKKYGNKIIFNIVGGGLDREKLLESIKEKEINNVNLLGLKKNPYPYIKGADAFLLSSRSEAYPTVVLEAMILKKFIIATDVPGVREILDKYDAKIIVENSLEGVKGGIDFYIKNKNKKYTYDNSYFIKENNKRINKVIELLNKEK